MPRKKSSKGLFKCDECAYETGRKQNLKVHKGLHNKSIFCETCQHRYPSISKLKRHQLQNKHGIYKTAEAESFECDKCDKSFPTPAILRKHIYDDHDNCEVCGKVFTNRRSLGDHRRSHPKVECSICHKKIFTYLMDSHVLLHSDSTEELLECGMCDYSSRSKWDYKTHMERNHQSGEASRPSSSNRY